MNIVRCPPVTMVLIRRPDLRYQLGFSVQNGIVSTRNTRWRARLGAASVTQKHARRQVVNLTFCCRPADLQSDEGGHRREGGRPRRPPHHRDQRPERGGHAPREDRSDTVQCHGRGRRPHQVLENQLGAPPEAPRTTLESARSTTLESPQNHCRTSLESTRTTTSNILGTPVDDLELEVKSFGWWGHSVNCKFPQCGIIFHCCSDLCRRST